MSNFSLAGRGTLEPVAQQFALRVVSVGDDLALAGGDFAVLFMADRFDVDVAYVEPDGRGKLRMVGMTAYVVRERLTPVESALYGNPTGPAGYVLASLRVFAAGLASRCPDTLGGGRDWLQRLRARDPGRWADVSTAAPVAEALNLRRASAPLSSRHNVPDEGRNADNGG